MYILKDACKRQFNNTTGLFGRQGIDMRIHWLNPPSYEMQVDITP